MESGFAVWVGACFAGWWALFWASGPVCLWLCPPLRGASRREQMQAFVRLPSLVNCLVATGMALAILLDTSSPLLADRIDAVSPVSSALYCVATGYFLFDVAESFVDYHGHAFLAHGVLCSFVYGLALFVPILHYYGAVFLMFEASTVFLNIGWFIKSVYKYPATSLPMIVVNACFAVSFFLARIVFGFYQSYYFFVDIFALRAAEGSIRPVLYFFMATNVFLCSLNVFWFYKILLMASRSLGFGARDNGDAKKNDNKRSKKD